MSFSKDSKNHILVYPIAGSGHIIPLLDLTHILLTRGFTITILVSPSELPLLQPLLSFHTSSLHTLLLSPPYNPDQYWSYHPLIARIFATTQLFDPILKWFQSHPSPPTAIISDFFLGWTNELAYRLGVPRIAFWPSGALGSSVFHAVWRDADVVGYNENHLLSFPEIPNSLSFPSWQVTHLSHQYIKGDPVWESFRNGMLANLASWGIVYNSFERLEGVYIDHVKKQSGHGRVWAVGPLLPDENGPITSTRRGGIGSVADHQLLTWLDNKSDDSVVYICFGSRVTLSQKQMGSLTAALVHSKVNFILCTKAGDSSFIPRGFEDRVRGRGFIMRGWAPQLAILKHRAVGSFVTHCGWNSTLEGVAAGVMMLTWPNGADQFGNAKLLVDQLRVGARVCEGGADSVPNSTELARLLDESLSGDRPERVKAKELSDAAAEAVVNGGSSRKDLDMFANLLSQV